MNRSSLKVSTISGIVWSFSELVLRRGAGVLTTLLLAWFLQPTDFGLLAMMAGFLAFSNVLVDAGFGQALIRKLTVTPREYDTAFYANITLAILVYVLLFTTAPQIADFYKEDLVDLIRVTGLAVIFTAFSVVQRAVLSRAMKFKLQMKVSLPATLISGVIAIVLAYLGYGVWALVAQIVVQAMLNSLLYWRLALWRPSLSFGWMEFKEIGSFSGFILLNQMVSIPFKYMYVIVIAKLFSAPIAGLYYFSQKIRDLLIDQLVTSIQTVTYPALSQVQNEPERLKNSYRQVVAATTFMAFPILLFLAALSENIFYLFLPEIWWPSIIYLQLMCLAALMYPLNAINSNILKVSGRSDLLFYLALLKKAVAIGIFAVSFRYGIIAILLGQTLSSVLGYIPNSFYSKRLINYTVYEQVNDFLPCLLLSVSIGFMLWWLQSKLNWPEFFELLVLCGFGILIYLLGAWLLKLHALKLANELFNSVMKRKAA